MRRVARKTTAIGLLGLALSGTAFADSPPSGHVAALPERFTDFVPGAQRLEGRLLAPCCWDSSRQTLDIHGSPVANELRREIRSRLKAGETPDTIEADLVRRYTTKILAVPTDGRIPTMGVLLVVGLAGAFVFAATRVAKWKKQTQLAPATPAPKASGPDEWDAQIDSELEDRD